MEKFAYYYLFNCVDRSNRFEYICRYILCVTIWTKRLRTVKKVLIQVPHSAPPDSENSVLTLNSIAINNIGLIKYINQQWK